MCCSSGNDFFIWCLIILNNIFLTTENGYSDVYRPEKQLNLETCLDRFEVHSNTIIRTGESQAIGGKFLQGLELETSEKCQRLCCETENCDVYVFEEKNFGYCYLFHCGSPKNFHCRFTRHFNYTSALIAQYNSVFTTTPKQRNQILPNISTQEQELISLRPVPNKNVFSLPSQPVYGSINENRRTLGKLAEGQNLTCGRFEFLCHSGECIAVYNACNGIPQCVDGSDEGPECFAATKSIDLSSQQQEKEHETVERQNFKANQDERMPEPIIKQNEFVVASPSEGIYRKLPVLQPEKDHVVLNRTSYNKAPLQITTPYNAKPTVQNFNQNEHWVPQQWQKSLYTLNDQPSMVHAEGNSLHPAEITDNDSKLNGEKSLQPLQNTEGQSHIGRKENILNYSEYSSKFSEKDKNHTVSDHRKASPALIKEATQSSIVSEYETIERRLQLNFANYDGRSERPSGAVLSLVLGLFVAGVIVILLIYRLQTVGRRGNRHRRKDNNAPDEDFLIKGMYL